MHPPPPPPVAQQNLTLELATMGDLKLVERLQQYTLGPGASRVIRANIKVRGCECGARRCVRCGGRARAPPGAARTTATPLAATTRATTTTRHAHAPGVEHGDGRHLWQHCV
jgi:hypothetical protein